LIALNIGLYDNQSIKGLYLSANLFGFTGCLALAEALRSSTVIKILDMRSMRLSVRQTRDITHLIEVLQNNQSLTEISYTYRTTEGGICGLICQRNMFIDRYKSDLSTSAVGGDIGIHLVFHLSSLRLKEVPETVRNGTENIRVIERQELKTV
jgi:hypothetical protein